MRVPWSGTTFCAQVSNTRIWWKSKNQEAHLRLFNKSTEKKNGRKCLKPKHKITNRHPATQNTALFFTSFSYVGFFSVRNNNPKVLFSSTYLPSFMRITTENANAIEPPAHFYPGIWTRIFSWSRVWKLFAHKKGGKDEYWMPCKPWNVTGILLSL